MAIIDDILGLLRSEYKPAPGEFSRFNRQFLAEKLHLKEHGRERGARGIPEPDATDLDTVEQDIVDAMQAQALEDRQRTMVQLRAYEDRLKSINPKGTSAIMMATAQKSIAAFKSQMMQVRADLDHDRKELIDRERALAAFKERHRLTRPPHPPKSHLLALLLLLTVFLAEALPNGAFLSEGSEFGLIGGVVSALMFSVLNLAGGWILGRYALPFLGIRPIAGKFWGFVLALVSVALIAGATLLSAHYRMAITAGATELEAAHEAPLTLLATPFHFLDDVKSIVMVGAGLLCGVVAAIEGFRWQDPYPGYARVAKHLADAKDIWAQTVSESVDNLTDVYDEAAKKIEVMQSELRDQQLMLPEILGNRKRLVDAFNAHLRHIEDVGRYLIDVYREANIEARSERKPAHFARKWEMHDQSPLEQPTEVVSVDEHDWSEVGRALMAATEQLTQAHSEALAWISQVEITGSALHADAGVARQRQSGEKSESAKDSELKHAAEA